MDYEQFLASKMKRFQPSGFDVVPELCPSMFPHQAAVCSWALRLGKAAAFLGTGLGKSLIELEWARCVYQATERPVLILAPLAVARQLVREAERFGIVASYVSEQSEVTWGINISNYERLHKFDAQVFSGIVLDESSCLKSFNSKTRTSLIEAFAQTSYKLAATATPAPNDYTELGNHAEFLGVMTRTEMLSMFFVHDGGSTQDWRIKGHAQHEFWKWVCSWAVFMRSPADVGFDGSAYILPPLHFHDHVIDIDTPTEGFLFALPASSLSERLAARRSTVDERVTETARIVAAEPDEQWCIWANLNDEAEAIVAAIPGAVNLTGSDTPEDKERKLLAFIDGEIRYLVSKASIVGFGINAQNCSHTIFAGVNDSWEQFFQAIRRFWRFGQTRPVHCHIVSASTEGNVIENLRRKDVDAEHMAAKMTEYTSAMVIEGLKSTAKHLEEYVPDYSSGEGWDLFGGDCVDHARSLPDNSVHYSLYSPPFESLYTYSPSDRDMGELCRHRGVLEALPLFDR